MLVPPMAELFSGAFPEEFHPDPEEALRFVYNALLNGDEDTRFYVASDDKGSLRGFIIVSSATGVWMPHPMVMWMYVDHPLITHDLFGLAGDDLQEDGFRTIRFINARPGMDTALEDRFIQAFKDHGEIPEIERFGAIFDADLGERLASDRRARITGTAL